VRCHCVNRVFIKKLKKSIQQYQQQNSASPTTTTTTIKQQQQQLQQQQATNNNAKLTTTTTTKNYRNISDHISKKKYTTIFQIFFLFQKGFAGHCFEG